MKIITSQQTMLAFCLQIGVYSPYCPQVDFNVFHKNQQLLADARIANYDNDIKNVLSEALKNAEIKLNDAIKTAETKLETAKKIAEIKLSNEQKVADIKLSNEQKVADNKLNNEQKVADNKLRNEQILP